MRHEDASSAVGTTLDRALVRTTGLRIDQDGRTAGLRLTGLLPKPRDLLLIRGDFSALRVEGEVSAHDRSIVARAACLEVGCESRVVIEARGDLEFAPAIDFRPRHQIDRRARGDVQGRRAILMTDEAGGFLILAPRSADRARVLRLRAGEVMEIQVFPPRPPRPDHLRLRVAHEGRPRDPLPDAARVASLAAHAEVFALHAYFWREEDHRRRPRWSRYRFRPCPWFNARHEALDEVALARLMTEVRAAGLRFLPYLSPRFSAAPNMLDEIARLQKRWQFDGLYLDGLRGDMAEQLAFMRGLRALLGEERLIYLNASTGPLRDAALITPAIDAWADIVLRGDSGRGGLDRATFLREAVSGWNRSNAIGLWCHYGSWGLPLPWDRPPSAADVEAALKAHARLWRRSFWPGGAARLAAFDRRYEEALLELAAREEAAIEQRLDDD